MIMIFVVYVTINLEPISNSSPRKCNEKKKHINEK